MTTAARRAAHWPRVLIVEDDPTLALATMKECVSAGLEPKLCMGPDRGSSCPGLAGDACPRTKGVEATLLSITTGSLRRAAPSCIGGRVVLAGERPLVGAATTAVVHPDRVISYPYSPKESAALLFDLVKDERRRRAWQAFRERLVRDDVPETAGPGPEARPISVGALHEAVAGGEVIVT